ncbi:MAG: N-acetylglucosamine-6-phosphate deacetylase [Chitinophagaceae bacterium]
MHNPRPLAIVNGTIYTGRDILFNKTILVEHGSIADIVENAAIPPGYDKEDLKGLNISPCFVDLQIYGGNGRMFSHDLSVASLQATYDYCLAGGAAHFMITMATNAMEKCIKGIEVVRMYWESGGQGLLGLHLEGPYINPVKKGAHIESYIKRPSLEEVQWLLDKGNGVIKMMTLAPEMCEQSVINLLLENGILVSAGHSNATYKEAMQAFENGIPVTTHLFNAMSAFQSREPGLVGAIYDHDKVKSSLVCDGVHVDYAAIRISKRIMKERLFFITDAVAETPAGEYQHVFRGDRYTLPDGTLSGSSLTMMSCVRNAVKHAGIELDEALRMASLYPSQMIRQQDNLGYIQQNARACFVVFDDELSVQRVMC